MLVPAGWAQFGSDRFGLLVATPQSWIDWTWALRDAGAIERFGPHLLMIADSQQTAEQIMGGTSPAQGAYAFGFLNPLGERAITAEAALNELLAELEPESLSRVLARLRTHGVTTHRNTVSIADVAVLHALCAAEGQEAAP
jgi:hypothetical protein